MGLKYNVLWVDDQIEDVQEYGLIRAIEEYLHEMGFIPFVAQYEDIKNAENDLKITKYDLVLSDFNIGGEGANGDVLISNIRAGKIYTEVLFYSAQSGFPEIAKQLFQDRVSFIQLTGTNGYKKLEDKIKWLIDQTLTRFHEIESLRGLVMAETSFLDNQVKSLLTLYFEMDKENKTTLRKSILKKIEKSLNGNMKDGKLKLADKSDLEIIDSRLFDANKKARTIQDLIVLENINSDEKLADFFNLYKQDVLDLRNDLAHAPAKRENGKEFLIVSRKNGEEYIEFNLDTAICIRKNLLEYGRLLDLVREDISK